MYILSMVTLLIVTLKGSKIERNAEDPESSCDCNSRSRAYIPTEEEIRGDEEETQCSHQTPGCF